MTANQTSAFAPDYHGFFDDLVTMLVSLSSYMFTMHVSIASNHPKPLTARPLPEWLSYIEPIKKVEYPLALARNADNHDLVVYPAMLLMHLSLNSWPQFIEYKIVSRGVSQPDARLSTQQNSHIISRIIGASFTNYYSNSEPMIKSRYGTDVDKWPEAIRFAWVLRNGFAHGSKLKISNPALRPVAWAIWSFDHHHNGQKFLFEAGMLGVGDVVALMSDVDTYVRV